MTRNSTSFVCGTDTGVGKTLVTGALCAWLNAQGIRSGAYKPFESGCARNEGLTRHLRRADSEYLKKMASMPEPLDVINPYYFREALAPGIAARRSGRKISWSLLKKNLRLLQKKYEVLFVEGAGGLLVPVAGRKTNLDLIKFFRAPVLLIARLGLGTINHTLLTLEHLRKKRVSVLGVILNDLAGKRGVSERTNWRALEELGVPVIGVFPYLKNRSREKLIKATMSFLLGSRLRTSGDDASTVLSE